MIIPEFKNQYSRFNQTVFSIYALCVHNYIKSYKGRNKRLVKGLN